MLNRVLIPEDARIPQDNGSTTNAGKPVRSELLVPRRLIAADARMPETAPNADSGSPARRDVAVSRHLVPANARIGETEVATPAAQARAAETQENVFHEALLEGAWETDQRKPLDWAISLGIHLVIIAAVIVVPLFVTQAIDLSQFRYTYLVSPALGAPAVPAPPPPPAAAIAPHPQQAARPQTLVATKLIAPIAIPKAVVMPRVAEAPEITGVPGGVAGGVPGGEIGGVLGGVLGGTLGAGEPAPPPPPPPPPAAVAASGPATPLRVGGQVQRPHVIFAPQPKYPPLAMQARVQGVVEIEAIIDEHGNVVQMKAISGSGLLIPEAMRAVAQWKYEPTYLNGVPYPVDLTVDVTFHL